VELSKCEIARTRVKFFQKKRKHGTLIRLNIIRCGLLLVPDKTDNLDKMQ
jgi:hypothetical protein